MKELLQTLPRQLEREALGHFLTVVHSETLESDQLDIELGAAFLGANDLTVSLPSERTLIEAFVAVRAAYQSSSLSAIEREVVSITNAVANNCAYCVAAHSTSAQMADTPPAVLAALRAGNSPAEPRLKALSDFSRKLTATRGQISEADLQTFLAAGFTTAQALEVVVGGAVSLMANYTNHLAHAFSPFHKNRPKIRFCGDLAYGMVVHMPTS